MSNNYGHSNAHSVLCPKMHASGLKPKFSISDAPRVATMRNCLLESWQASCQVAGTFHTRKDRSQHWKWIQQRPYASS